MKHSVRFLISIGLACVLGLGLWVGIASADPLNAELVLSVSQPVVTVGDTFQLTITLATMDAAEAFDEWYVKLDYNEAAFQIDSVWLNESVIPGGLPAGVVHPTGGIVQVYDLTFSGDSGDNDPWDLAVITFTATAPGSTDFAYVTDILANDTSFRRASDGQRWLPGQLTLAQVSAEQPSQVSIHGLRTTSSIAALGVLAVGAVGAVGAVVWLVRKRRE